MDQLHNPTLKTDPHFGMCTDVPVFKITVLVLNRPSAFAKTKVT